VHQEDPIKSQKALDDLCGVAKDVSACCCAVLLLLFVIVGGFCALIMNNSTPDELSVVIACDHTSDGSNATATASKSSSPHVNNLMIVVTVSGILLASGAVVASFREVKERLESQKIG